MLIEYVRAAIKKARYEILPDDGSYYGRIPGFKGLWANARRSGSAGASYGKLWRAGS